MNKCVLSTRCLLQVLIGSETRRGQIRSDVDLLFIGILGFLLGWFPLGITVFVGENTLLTAKNLVLYRCSDLCNLEKENGISRRRRCIQ